MDPYSRIAWRNRLRDNVPGLARLFELRRLVMVSGQWRSAGWQAPAPHFVRHANLIAEAARIGAKVFVETGTFRGDTSLALASRFQEVHTIEIHPRLAELARRRFKHHPEIHFHEGDSPEVLSELCPNLMGPVLFYLDGHDSGGVTGSGAHACPVLDELAAISSACKTPYAVVIDDARLFGCDPAYPTVDRLVDPFRSSGRIPEIHVECDAIFLRFPISPESPVDHRQ